MPSKCRVPKQKLDLDLAKTNFPQLRFTKSNEKLVRNVIFIAWDKYFAKRRARYLRLLGTMDEASREYRKLARTKFVKFEQPSDLAGACKISAQVAYVVFPLAGQVVSNKHHTFVVLPNSEIYDMNRECRDVANLARKRLHPYQVSLAYSNSREARLGRESWHDLIGEVLNQLTNLARINSSARPIKSITALPDWAQPKYINASGGGDDSNNNDNDNDNNS